MRHAQPGENPRWRLARLLRQRQQQVLGGDKLILELFRFLERLVQHVLERRRKVMVGRAAYLGQSLDCLLRLPGHGLG